MPDAPEIPEANDPFEKRVAVTIAIVAVCLAFISNAGDNGTAQSIVKTSEAASQWAYYQAKSIKGSLVTVEGELLARLATTDQKAELERLKAEATRYDKEKTEIKAAAEVFQAEAKQGADIDDRADLAALFLQVSIVISSIAILAKSHQFWWAGVALGAGGLAVGATLGVALVPW
ncbi:MAG: DUF4337 domain-containing protein [Chthoniobacteraceae bacterium]